MELLPYKPFLFKSVTGHPKYDILFDLAWNYGHSSGLEAVTDYTEELSELLI